MPITKAAWGPYAVLVYKDMPVKTLGELIAHAKEQPDKLNMGSAGIGTMGHLASAYLTARSDIKLTHIPFRGSGPALTAVMGGQLDVLLDPPFTALPAIQSGNARALGVTGEKRSPLLPDVPTVAELGFPGFAAGHWGGFFAPAGTPPAIIQKLNSDFVARAAGSEGARGPPQPGARDHRQHAGSVPQGDRGRDRVVGQGHHRCRHQA